MGDRVPRIPGILPAVEELRFFRGIPLRLASKGRDSRAGVSCEPFDRARFQEALEEIRSLTLEQPEKFVPRLKELCSSAGVVVLFVPELPKCRVCGATRWIGDNPVIQLSEWR